MEPPGQDRSSPIDLEQVVADLNRAVSDDRFWATRGKAVQAYARLEQHCAEFLRLFLIHPHK
jgi:hypothetical protein